MRRADRLFLLIHALRGRRSAITAQRLAETLEVSLRTVYRDVADLQRSGVPIEGEAGVGYMLRKGSDIPPLMFTPDELEALVVGTRFVRAFGGVRLGREAAAALLKIEAVLPPELRERSERTRIFAPEVEPAREQRPDRRPARGGDRARRCCAWTTATTTGAPASARSNRCAWRSGAAAGRSARGAGCAATSATSGRTASSAMRPTGEIFVESRERGLEAYLRAARGSRTTGTWVRPAGRTRGRRAGVGGSRVRFASRLRVAAAAPLIAASSPSR